MQDKDRPRYMPCTDFKQYSFVWSHRESNSDLIFRRDLFYPLNYETPHCCIIMPHKNKRHNMNYIIPCNAMKQHLWIQR